MDQQRDDEVWAKSYSYVRTAIVGLLAALLAAVVWQIGRQGGTVLSSVSAYYYTPAQGIFVGSLIGFGACMIALVGSTVLEDVLLNVAGMCAAVVAVVPTSRGEDFDAAVRACRESGSPLLTQKATGALDCPTVQALEQATRANVENNVFALLVVAALGLVAALFFPSRSTPQGIQGLAPRFWAGFSAAVAVLLLGLVLFVTAMDWFIGHAHFSAAVGLLICIVGAAVTNALRHDKSLPEDVDLGTAGRALVRSPRQLDRYAWIAWLMIAVGVVGILLVVSGVVSLFWLEIVVAGLFVVFWTLQTVEASRRAPVPGGSYRTPATEPPGARPGTGAAARST